MFKGSLTVTVVGMILGVEEKTKRDGTPIRIVRFSDTTGKPGEALDFDMARSVVPFKPARMTIAQSWGDGQYGPYMKMEVVKIEPLDE